MLVTQLGKWGLYYHRGYQQAQDFTQYYMGGLMVLRGESDSMYPMPTPAGRRNAGFEESSTLRPKYAAAARERGVGEGSFRFMQPPPAALLFVPLALLPHTWSHLVWVVILTFAAWGVALQAGEMLRLSLDRSTRWIGILILLVCISPQAHRWVRVGNLSVVMAWLTGYIVLELVRRDSARGAAAMVIGTALKYAQLVLAPLHIVMRRWRTLLWTAIFGLALLILSLLILGVGPYRTFVTDIAPTLGRTSIPENQALYRFILVAHGIDREDGMPRAAEITFRAVQFGLLGVILGLIVLKPRDHWSRPDHVFAAALALVAWLIIFSPIFWEHYHAYLTPFWGWLAYQAMRSRVKLVAVIVAIGLAYLPTSLLLQQLHWRKLPEPLFSHLLWSAVIMLVLAISDLLKLSKRRLVADER